MANQSDRRGPYSSVPGLEQPEPVIVPNVNPLSDPTPTVPSQTPSAPIQSDAGYFSSFKAGFGQLGDFLGTNAIIATRTPIQHSGQVLTSGNVSVSIDPELPAKQSTFGTVEYFRFLARNSTPTDPVAFNTALTVTNGPTANAVLSTSAAKAADPYGFTAALNTRSYSSIRPAVQPQPKTISYQSISSSTKTLNIGIEDLTSFRPAYTLSQLSSASSRLAPVGSGGVSYSPRYTSTSYPTYITPRF